ncbi:MAG: hypothetical protein AMXMBFR59_22820 [Rhodanobacteraceae bacterium]
MKRAAGWTVVITLLSTLAVTRAEPVRTTLVTDANTAPVAVGSDPGGFYADSGRVYFSAWRHDVGRQLFSTDGTSANEVLVFDFSAIGNLSDPYVLGRIGDRLIVSVQDITPVTSAYGHVIVALDLTTRVVTKLADFAPQTSSHRWRIERLASMSGRLVFTDLVSETLWSTDGTAAGTQQLYAPTTLDDTIHPQQVCVLDGRAVFSGRHGSGRALWTSDGTASGTRPTVAIAETGVPVSAVRAGAHCHFLMSRSPGWAWWRSDGTAAGTQLVRSGDTYPNYPIVAIDDVALVVADEGDDVRLYRSDQSVPVVEFDGMATGDVADVNGRLAFLRRESFGSPFVVTVSDGTPSGTRTATLGPEPLLLSGDGTLVAAGERFYVRSGGNLYAIDPLTARAVDLGTQPLFTNRRDIASLGPLAIGAADDGVTGNELWRSDGTVAGTHRLHDIARRTADGVRLSRNDAVVRADTVYFVNYQGVPSGPHSQLWRTDGTASGTRGLPHAAGSHTARVAAFGDGVVFTTLHPDEPAARVFRTDRDFSAVQLLWESATYSIAVASDASVALFHCDTLMSKNNLCSLRSSDLQAGVVAPGGTPADRYGVIGAVGTLVMAVHRSRLWRSDGTLPGTFVVAPDLPVTDVRSDNAAPVAGGALLFTACVGMNGGDCGLYRSDGTAAGTQRLAAPSDQIIGFAPLGDRQAFITYVGDLWITDGSADGTRQIASGLGTTDGMSSTGRHLHMVVARHDPLRFEYAVSDGTASGTRLVPRPGGLGANQGRPLVLDADTVVFACTGPETGDELCRMSGDGDGWTLAADIVPGRRSSAPRMLATAGNVGYFSADDGYHGMELWRVEPFVEAIFASDFQ